MTHAFVDPYFLERSHMDHWSIKQEGCENSDKRASRMFILTVNTLISIEASTVLTVVVEEPGMNLKIIRINDKRVSSSTYWKVQGTVLSYISEALERRSFFSSPITHVANSDDWMSFLQMWLISIDPFEIARDLLWVFRTAVIILSSSSHEYRIVEVGEVSWSVFVPFKISR